MAKNAVKSKNNPYVKKQPLLKYMKRHWILYLMLVPGMICLILFKYIPMGGIIIAFKNYNPFIGIWDSPWVGLTHFKNLFRGSDFMMLMRNTLAIFFMMLFLYFPMPIIVALLLNEIRSQVYKKVVQTCIYIPHFVSWVIVYSVTYLLLTKGSGVGNSGGGIIYEISKKLTGQQIKFFESPDWFRPLMLIQQLWKETGWGTVIFLAALAGVDVQLYEAAEIDGANRLQRMWHITLPAIKGTIIVMLIMRCGSVLNTGFEQIFLLQNSMNRKVSEVFDTYVYRQGITQGSFSYSTAVGLFKGVVGTIMVLMSDRIAKMLGESGLY